MNLTYEKSEYSKCQIHLFMQIISQHKNKQQELQVPSFMDLTLHTIPQPQNNPNTFTFTVRRQSRKQKVPMYLKKQAQQPKMINLM